LAKQEAGKGSWRLATAVFDASVPSGTSEISPAIQRLSSFCET
jgi:hypothetical protein